MSIQVRSNEQPQAKPEAEKPAEGAAQASPEAKLSAQEDSDESTEQKESSESGTEETEAVEEETDEGEETVPKDGADKSEESEKDKPKRKNGFQRRVDKLNARITASQQETEFWRRQALKGASDSKPEAQIETKPAATEGKPKPDDYDTHADWVEAVVDWKSDQKLKDRDQKLEKSRIESDQAKVVETYSERAKSFAAKTPDYDEVLSDVDDIPLSAAIREIVLSSENGPELAYELAKNREECARICKLPPLAAAREMGKIESRLASSASEIKAEPKKITNAPKPLEPVGGSGKGAVKKSLEEIASTGSQAEYEAARRADMKRRRQA